MNLCWIVRTTDHRKEERIGFLNLARLLLGPGYAIREFLLCLCNSSYDISIEPPDNVLLQCFLRRPSKRHGAAQRVTIPVFDGVGVYNEQASQQEAGVVLVCSTSRFRVPLRRIEIPEDAIVITETEVSYCNRRIFLLTLLAKEAGRNGAGRDRVRCILKKSDKVLGRRLSLVLSTACEDRNDER